MHNTPVISDPLLSGDFGFPQLKPLYWRVITQYPVVMFVKVHAILLYMYVQTKFLSGLNLYVPVNSFSWRFRDGSSWIEPVIRKDSGHNAVIKVRIKPDLETSTLPLSHCASITSLYHS